MCINFKVAYAIPFRLPSLASRWAPSNLSELGWCLPLWFSSGWGRSGKRGKQIRNRNQINWQNESLILFFNQRVLSRGKMVSNPHWGEESCNGNQLHLTILIEPIWCQKVWCLIVYFNQRVLLRGKMVSNPLSGQEPIQPTAIHSELLRWSVTICKQTSTYYMLYGISLQPYKCVAII